MKTPLEKINCGNPLHFLSQAGFSPDQIKDLIKNTLSPFFIRKELLEETDVGRLAIEGVNVGKIITHPNGEEFLKEVLIIYRESYSKNKKEVIEVILSWEQSIQDSIREFWNQCIFENEKSSLDLESFRFESFRNIGGITEACIQPYLRQMIELILLSKGRKNVQRKRKLTFGQVVRLFSNSFTNNDFMAPAPWGVFLSDWRNIAQHHSSKTEGEFITASYEGTGAQSVIKLTRDELSLLNKEVFLRLSVLKAARNIFLFEHLDEIKELNIKINGNISGSDKSLLLEVSSAVATQGFQVIEFKTNDVETIFGLRDIYEGEVLKRFVHSTQFLVMIWLYFKTDIVRIKYSDSKDVIKGIASANGNDLMIATADNGLDYEMVANCTKFEYLHKDITS